jgi:phosphinothricin acetyltransferase
MYTFVFGVISMIRPVKKGDEVQIVNIYNYYIKNTIVTFEEDPVTEKEMVNRIQDVTGQYPWFVYENNGTILGYIYVAQYKSRCAYKQTGEVTVYVRDGEQGKGIGSALFEKMLISIENYPVHAIIAGIALPNESSIRLHEKFGFSKVAHFKEIGYKFGKWIDVGYWERLVG